MNRVDPHWIRIGSADKERDIICGINQMWPDQCAKDNNRP